LVVNVNGTLIRTDSLIEALLVTLLRKPSTLGTIFPALLRGRPTLKRRLAELDVYDPGTLPLREDVLAFLRAQHQQGRELHLATAADQSVADCLAKRAGVFNSVEGSRDGMNLKGARKLEHLRERFPGGFSYAVNNLGDRGIWRNASSIVLVGASPITRRAVVRLGRPIEEDLPAARATLRQWLRAIRVHQWSKNLLLFIPLLLAHRYGDRAAWLQALLGFLSLGLVASATYLINDLSDLDADRAHDTKRHRPVARADIGPGTALAAALALLAAGLLLGLSLAPAFAGLLVLYAAISLSYSLQLKRLPLIDVFVLGGLYTLRIFMGTVLLALPPSPWLLVFSLFFFLSLSMAKRHVEIVKAAQKGAADELLKGRGYRPSDAPLSLTFGMCTSTAAILILFLYIVNDAYPVRAYAHPQWLWAIGILVFIWTSRIWLLSHRGELNDDPVAFALKDPASLLLGAVVLVVFAMAVL